MPTVTYINPGDSVVVYNDAGRTAAAFVTAGDGTLLPLTETPNGVVVPAPEPQDA